MFLTYLNYILRTSLNPCYWGGGERTREGEWLVPLKERG